MDIDAHDDIFAEMSEMTALGQYRICADSTAGRVSVEWFRMLSRQQLTTDKMHSHEGIEIHFLLSGRHTFYSESTALSVESMEGIVVPSCCRHRLYNIGTHYMRYVLNFLLTENTETEENDFPIQAFKKSDICRFPVTPAIAAILRECTLEAEETRQGFMTMLESNILKLLVLTARELDGNLLFADRRPNRNKTLSNSITEEAVSYIEEHLSEAPSVNNIAHYMHISDKQLQRMFNKEFSCSVQRKIQQIRLRKAKTLLRNTVLSIGEIATLTGYLSAESFSRFFSRLEGMSPLVYRNAVLSQD